MSSINSNIGSEGSVNWSPHEPIYQSGDSSDSESSIDVDSFLQEVSDQTSPDPTGSIKQKITKPIVTRSIILGTHLDSEEAIHEEFLFGTQRGDTLYEYDIRELAENIHERGGKDWQTPNPVIFTSKELTAIRIQYNKILPDRFSAEQPKVKIDFNESVKRAKLMEGDLKKYEVLVKSLKSIISKPTETPSEKMSLIIEIKDKINEQPVSIKELFKKLPFYPSHANLSFETLEKTIANMGEDECVREIFNPVVSFVNYFSAKLGEGRVDSIEE